MTPRSICCSIYTILGFPISISTSAYTHENARVERRNADIAFAIKTALNPNMSIFKNGGSPRQPSRFAEGKTSGVVNNKTGKISEGWDKIMQLDEPIDSAFYSLSLKSGSSNEEISERSIRIEGTYCVLKVNYTASRSDSLTR